MEIIILDIQGKNLYFADRCIDCLGEIYNWGTLMKPASLLSVLLFLFAVGTLQGQLLQVKLGTSEQDLLLMAEARTREISTANSFSLISRTENTYQYRHIDDGYQLDITFTLKEDAVVVIKSTYTSKMPTYNGTMREYFEETVKDWHNKLYFDPNPRMAAQAMRSFEGYQPEAAAFTDPSMSLMFIFMYYVKDKQAVFTRMERKF